MRLSELPKVIFDKTCPLKTESSSPQGRHEIYAVQGFTALK